MDNLNIELLQLKLENFRRRSYSWNSDMVEKTHTYFIDTFGIHTGMWWLFVSCGPGGYITARYSNIQKHLIYRRDEDSVIGMQEEKTLVNTESLNKTYTDSMNMEDLRKPCGDGSYLISKIIGYVGPLLIEKFYSGTLRIKRILIYGYNIKMNSLSMFILDDIDDNRTETSFEYREVNAFLKEYERTFQKDYYSIRLIRPSVLKVGVIPGGRKQIQQETIMSKKSKSEMEATTDTLPDVLTNPNLSLDTAEDEMLNSLEKVMNYTQKAMRWGPEAEFEDYANRDPISAVWLLFIAKSPVSYRMRKSTDKPVLTVTSQLRKDAVGYAKSVAEKYSLIFNKIDGSLITEYAASCIIGYLGPLLIQVSTGYYLLDRTDSDTKIHGSYYQIDDNGILRGSGELDFGQSMFLDIGDAPVYLIRPGYREISSIPGGNYQVSDL